MLDVKRNLTTMTDFYELTMSAGYRDEGYVDKIAVFDMFFRRVPDATSIASPKLPGRSGLIFVYTLSGQLAAMASSTTEALRALPRGIYVTGRKKYY